MMLRRFLQNKIAQNAAWIIGCKGIQAALGLAITMLTARLFGPENYGSVSYAASLVTFITPIAQLGFTSTLVGEMIADPENEGEIIGSAMLSSIISSTLCMIGIWVFVRITTPDDPVLNWVCVLYSTSLFFQGMELIQYWFHAKMLSKYVAVMTLIAYVIVSGYQLAVLILGKGVMWYAVSKSIEYAMIVVGLIYIYRIQYKKRLKPSLRRSVRLLRNSFFYMLSGLMVMMLGQTDRIMILLMLGETSVGLYSAAVVCANLTEFVFLAIIDSFRPSIFRERQNDMRAYEQRISLMYSIVIGLALIQSIFIVLFADPIVYLMYGSAYKASAGILRVLVWYTAFSYIGSARMIWIYAEGKHKILCLVNFLGAVVNIGLNFLWIPMWGVKGAALASLITQAFTNVAIGWILPQLRRNNALIVRALDVRSILKPKR